MKKLFIANNGQATLKEVNDPHIETKGTIVNTSHALISSGTELSIIQWKKIDSLPIYKQVIKSRYIRKRLFSELRKNTIKSLFNLFKMYTEKGKFKNFKNPSLNLTPLGYSCSGIVEKSNIDAFRPYDRVACAGSNHP